MSLPAASVTVKFCESLLVESGDSIVLPEEWIFCESQSAETGDWATLLEKNTEACVMLQKVRSGSEDTLLEEVSTCDVATRVNGEEICPWDEHDLVAPNATTYM